MAIDYKKQNMTVRLTAAVQGYNATGEYGVDVINDFESKDIIKVRNKEEESVVTLVPFHSARALAYARQFIDAEKPDPYGCTEGGEGSSKACEAKACSGKAGC